MENIWRQSLMKSHDIQNTNLEGVKVIRGISYNDERGFFKELYNRNILNEFSIENAFVQDNFSRSSKGVMRGLHFQKNFPQGKLVTCLRGSVFDVVVDINKESKTFGSYFSIELTEDNHKQLWIPPGYAHGFCVLSDSADFYYKCTEFYHPEDEHGIAWNDPEININWPIKDLIISNKDLSHCYLKDL